MNLLWYFQQQGLKTSWVLHRGSSCTLATVSLNHLVIVVAQGSAQLVVVHVGLVLAQPPQLRHFLRFEELELSVRGRPAYQVLVTLVQQQLQQELPQSDGTVHTCSEGGRRGRRFCPRWLFLTLSHGDHVSYLLPADFFSAQSSADREKSTKTTSSYATCQMPQWQNKHQLKPQKETSWVAPCTLLSSSLCRFYTCVN